MRKQATWLRGAAVCPPSSLASFPWGSSTPGWNHLPGNVSQMTKSPRAQAPLHMTKGGQKGKRGSCFSSFKPLFSGSVLRCSVTQHVQGHIVASLHPKTPSPQPHWPVCAQLLGPKSPFALLPAPAPQKARTFVQTFPSQATKTSPLCLQPCKKSGWGAGSRTTSLVLSLNKAGGWGSGSFHRVIPFPDP